MFRPRSTLPIVAVSIALEVLTWRMLSPAPAACPHLLVGRVDGGVDPIHAAMRAERRACRTIAADRPWTTCEAR